MFIPFCNLAVAILYAATIVMNNRALICKNYFFENLKLPCSAAILFLQVLMLCNDMAK